MVNVITAAKTEQACKTKEAEPAQVKAIIIVVVVNLNSGWSRWGGSDIYSRGKDLSDLSLSLLGQRIVMTGYTAPRSSLKSTFLS